MPPAGKILTCIDCGALFSVTVDEQALDTAQGGANQPARCPECQANWRARQAERTPTQPSVSDQQVAPETVQRLSAVIEASLDGLAIVDRNGAYLYVNEAYVRIYGYDSPEELIGSNWRVVYQEDECRRFDQEIMPAVSSVGRWQGEAVGRRRDGSTFPQEFSLTALADAELVGVVRDITERKRAEEALQASEARFRSLVQNVSDVIIVLDADGTILYESPSVERVLGYKPEHKVGDNSFSWIHPDDLDRTQRLFAEILATPGVTRSIQLRARHHDGSWRHIEASGINLLDDPSVGGIVATYRDITERKRAEEALQASEARFRAIFAGAAIGIMLADLAGRVVESNPALQVMLGYRGDELSGTVFTDLNHPDDARLDEDLYHELVAGKRDYYQLEKRLIRKDGRVVWGYLVVSLIWGGGGEPQFAIGMVEDITERKRVTAELAEAHRRLAVSQEVERLALAHELHDSAVQQLLGISYRLVEFRRSAGQGQRPDAQPDTEVVAGLEAIRQDVLDVVTQLRELIGELRPAGLEELGLAIALEGYIARLQREGRPEMPVIALDPDWNEPVLPQPVALCLFRVAQEALRNAVRHARARHITLSLHRHGDVAVLQVRDDGGGFPVPVRLSELTQASHFGLVGMAERVAWAGGHFTIQSQPGAGTTVTARVPLDETEGHHGEDDPRAAG